MFISIVEKIDLLLIIIVVESVVFIVIIDFIEILIFWVVIIRVIFIDMRISGVEWFNIFIVFLNKWLFFIVIFKKFGVIMKLNKRSIIKFIIG